MITQAATIAHILETLTPLPLTHKRMFGEDALCLHGIVMAVVCADTLFIKPTPTALTVLPDNERGQAYPGFKEYILGSKALDDPDLCSRAPRAAASNAPPLKPEKPKPIKTGLKLCPLHAGTITSRGKAVLPVLTAFRRFDTGAKKLHG